MTGAVPTSLLTVAVLLLSGCAALGYDQDVQDAPLTEAPIGMGSIEGSVRTDEGMGVPDVLITLRPSAEGTSGGPELTTLTDGSGDFIFLEVTSGEWELTVGHPQYESSAALVRVLPGQTARVEIGLITLPAYRPHNVTVPIAGHFDCAAEIPIWTGDCMIVYETATGQNDTLTSEEHEFPFLVEPRWASILLEMTWEEGGPNQLDGMRLYVEKPELSLEGHSVKYARVDGPDSPLRLMVHRGEVPETADVDPDTQTVALIPGEGVNVLLRVFPRGNFYQYTSQVCDPEAGCLLGVGAGLNIQFTVYVTVFFNERAPEGFSAIPG